MYRAMREAVAGALESALAAEGYPTDDLGLEEPPDDVDAVLASSVAFRLASDAGDPPPQVAMALANRLSTSDIEYVSTVETQGPYLNFLPSERYFTETLRAAGDADYGTLESRERSVVVEHTSANPTGPVHVGRARNPIIGDALARILDAAGYDVSVHYYVNDAGRQMAVFTWAYERFDESDLPDPEREKSDYDLVRYYRKGNEFLESADADAVEAAEAEIQAIMQGLEAGDEQTYERVREVVDTVLEGMRESLARLPADFDRFVKETEFIRDGSTQAMVERLKALDAAVYDEDAWQLDLPDIDKNFVFLRSDGTSLYSTRDLAHHEWKFDHFDRAVTVLGEDHGLQVRQIESVLDLLGHDTDRLDQVLYSYVNLPEGKMSTRRGTGIDLDDLLDEAVVRAREEVERRLGERVRGDGLDDADVDRIARQVGIGAVRYDIVAKQPAKAITFEWERALDFEAQSAPYVQYVHARACGILDEAAAAGYAVPAGNGVKATHLDTAAEQDLLRDVARYPRIVEEAAADLEPHRIATFTREVAESFNAFYRECPVIDAAPAVRESRLALVVAARNTVANALEVLGIEAPDSM